MRAFRGCLLLLLPLMLVGAGCGSDEEQKLPTIQLLPNAKTPDEWAGRIVNRLMRPMNRDLEVLSNLDSPQIRIFILQQNPDTLRTVNKHMSDLGKCSDRLFAIGPPPQTAADKRQLNRIDAALHRACTHYVKISEVVVDAVKLLSSGRQDVVERGEERLKEAGPDSKAAADAYAQAIEIAENLDEFRLHGLKPSA
jgi:hypothetical protein